jgi:hypothetical protein
MCCCCCSCCLPLCCCCCCIYMLHMSALTSSSKPQRPGTSLSSCDGTPGMLGTYSCSTTRLHTAQTPYKVKHLLHICGMVDMACCLAAHNHKYSTGVAAGRWLLYTLACVLQSSCSPCCCSLYSTPTALQQMWLRGW